VRALPSERAVPMNAAPVRVIVIMNAATRRVETITQPRRQWKYQGMHSKDAMRMNDFLRAFPRRPVASP